MEEGRREEERVGEGEREGGGRGGVREGYGEITLTLFSTMILPSVANVFSKVFETAENGQNGSAGNASKVK